MKYVFDNNIIDIKYVQEQIEMKKRKEYLDRHQFKIWQSNKGKWKTYLPDKEKGRVQRERNTKEEIEDLICDYYKKIEETYYIEDIFNLWSAKKLEYGEIQKQTYDRYKTDFHRFFDNTLISKVQINMITENDLEDFVKKTIKEKKLSSKAYSGLRLLIIGIFKYAKKQKLTNISITQFFGDLDLSKKSFNKKRVTSEESVFTASEVKQIEAFIENDPTIINLGILLAFQTGVRVGELSALKYSDITGKVLNVNKTEVRYRGEDGKYIFEVRESAKTDAGNRQVILSTKALDTIKAIRRQNPFGEFIFMKNGQRIKEKAFSVKITKICRYLGIKERSIHKARKTYATQLINAGVDEGLIIEQLGHTSIDCTKGYYYYNDKTIEEAFQQIEKAAN